MGRFKNLKNISIHLSTTRGISLISENGDRLGKLNDYFVDYEEMYPHVIAIQFKNKNQLFYIEWQDVLSFNLKHIKIRDKAIIGQSRTYPKVRKSRITTSLLANQFSGKTVEFPPLSKIILDRQIVDTSGKKVVRVNDIQFIRSGQELIVTHAEVGFRSMMRRLGYEKILHKLNNISPIDLLQNNTLINWKYVHAIPSKNIEHSNVQLNLTNEDIRKLHPADLADILEDLDGYGREALFNQLEPRLAAETLQEVDPDVQSSLLDRESPETAAAIIENMDTDDAADALNELDENKVQQIFSHIKDDEIKNEITELRNYDEDTAGGLMSTEFFEVSPDKTKQEILDIFKKEFNNIENIFDIFVTGQNQELLGICPIQNLLLASPDSSIENFMQKEDFKTLSPEVHWKEVAQFISKYNLINTPIINDENALLGIISVDDVLPWLLDEK